MKTLLLYDYNNMTSEGRDMATIQISSNFKTEEDWQLERLEDVEMLTDIIHEHLVNGARSHEIACAIIKFVKKGEG